MALNPSVIQHWKFKNNFFWWCASTWKICRALCGIYGARPCRRKFSNKLQVECFPLLNRLQLPPTYARAPVASIVSITYHNDSTHFSYSIYCSLCSLTRKKRGGGAARRGQNSYLHSVSLRCHWIDRSDALKRVFFESFFVCEVA